MNNTPDKKGLNINVKSFISAIIVLVILMGLTYGLTFLVPGGYISFWKWLLSPILVLVSEDSSSLIGIIVFLLAIGGVFNCLEKYGLMKYVLEKITCRFGKQRYRLLAIVTLFFMMMGSLVGIYEECVPLVPVIVAMAIRLGWDAYVGLGMSLLAAGCGFSAGVLNPFTVGVAQELVGLPMMSGIWFRLLAFVLVYALLVAFLYCYARRIEQSVEETKEGITLTEASHAVTGKGKTVVHTFCNGVVSVLPAIVMILMANSIKYTLVEANILDTILQEMIAVAKTLPRWSVILFIYLITLLIEFFVASGSAKAFLLMPLLVPVAEVFGISAQLCIVAYAFGDGFSNVFYPTNPVLLISLGLANVDYGKWMKWTWKFQVMTLILTGGLLLFGLVIGC